MVLVTLFCVRTRLVFPRKRLVELAAQDEQPYQANELSP
jgi:hypothetical protein